MKLNYGTRFIVGSSESLLLVTIAHMEYPLCSTHSSKHLTCSSSFNHHNTLMGKVLLVTLLSLHVRTLMPSYFASVSYLGNSGPRFKPGSLTSASIISSLHYSISVIYISSTFSDTKKEKLLTPFNNHQQIHHNWTNK